MDIDTLISNISNGFNNPQATSDSLASVLIMSAALAIYQYLVYRFVSKRSFYSKQFNIAMAVIPLFISTIIMTLQSNLLITLGTIGALAIIRFRTAIKDPIDMVYLLWSLHTGITCGCELYEVSVLTSLAATAFLFILELLPVQKAPYLLIININSMAMEEKILSIIQKDSRFVRVKSRNLTKRGVDMVIELRTKHEARLLDTLANEEGVINLSLVAYDGENFN